MPGKTKLSSYCLLRDDPRLKVAIMARMAQRGVTITELANHIETDISGVRKFIKKDEHSISQQKVIAICLYLGINVELNIEFE